MRAPLLAVAALAATAVRAGVPPVISIHGDADLVVPSSNSVRLHEALQRASVPNRMVTIPGGKHGGFPHAEMDTAYAAISAFLKDRIGITAP